MVAEAGIEPATAWVWAKQTALVYLCYKEMQAGMVGHYVNLPAE